MERPSRHPATQTTSTRGAAAGRPVSRGQRDYLAILADQTGLTYQPPESFAQARAEIDRLRKAKRTNRGVRRAELQDVSRALASGPASSVRDHEIDGHGSTAHWGTRSADRVDDGGARGDERCRAIGAFPNPYYQGFKHDGKVVIRTRADARRAYARLLWRRIKTEGRPVIEKLASLDGQLTGCCCRRHPCDREVLADTAAWAAKQLG